ncbi:FAD-dependent oxidoreductase [Blastopirellula sp. JC732]|uniref:FAD-dependent oxidoreductase n=1 Tax=Blastopirellula sediminis TaxID=2894196 RepID=A0A9X1MU60_9BACT|nr:FAD-dependent oxidoreductase [Blastopirellula sediminis]MCC9605046.1 FAD-dependent oxidoreductase [Blastopirellula sediminis]MCC9631654.1 FAD-dependent oxidoreductase [Blastopirellula sediminis]
MNRFVPIAMLAAFLFSLTGAAAKEPSNRYDVIVIGATPCGIATAVTAGRAGKSVLLVEPTSRFGGLVTNGLSHPDFHCFEALTGAYKEFNDRVMAYYTEKYGADSPQVKTSLGGTHGEPKVNLLVYQQMLAELPSVTLLTEHPLDQVDVADDHTIRSVTLRNPQGEKITAYGKVFVDGTYEGDLMAAAGVPFAVGREGKQEYGESLAPDEADDCVQGYNFRLTFTDQPENRVYPEPPEGYDRNDFLPLLKLLESGKLTAAMHRMTEGHTTTAIYKVQDPNLPNGKFDINDMSRGVVRLSLPQINNAWPNGDAKTRADIFAAHVRHNVGMLYFLQNDSEVPAEIQKGAREFGLCRDEFVDNHHLPVQLYVREARRMKGAKVFTQDYVSQEGNDVRSRFVPDSIAMGDYGPNCHGTDHEGPTIGGKHTGEFYQLAAPYQIPYGVILPKEHPNLLVPCAMSASHVGFCALRLEPIWASLGEAAGVAATIAIDENEPVQQVDPAAIRQQLHADGAATIYVTDVPRDHADFAAVQWWGSLGGLHGLDSIPADQYGKRGKHLRGQYYYAFPRHSAELDRPLDDALRSTWLTLAAKNQVSGDALSASATRGDFIRAAFQIAQDSQ